MVKKWEVGATVASPTDLYRSRRIVERDFVGLLFVAHVGAEYLWLPSSELHVIVPSAAVNVMSEVFTS